ncbi:uncharacterized protein FA14DRAFT_74704 [Meira miltonrushii]|uniref:C2H2-type domain-containing protein n=1 Tax=Meira miltonrushii TaxID=1280837 RepID=A0A316V4Q2_9BASI|nr:uncharacterized protein FA14DRAFT_74704 [Meira miltonrushii]PWN32500.1 hypothetical protein FA14DRAFT_74704 [Meira miltonrushii]
MNTNLYASLAALATPLDSLEQDQIAQLAEFSKMFSSFSTTNPTINLCSEMMDTGKPIANVSADAIPFDSPLDQSLGSPASTRDFQESPLQDLEFDFASTVADAPLFPDHGTQQQQHGELASMPLFGPEFSFSQQSVTGPIVGLKESVTSSQSSEGNAADYSFDAMARNMLSDMGNGRLNILSASPSTQSDVSVADSDLAARFIREYARSHAVRDIDVLVCALRGAGIDVSNEVVAEILATASLNSTPSSSPNASPSPMILPEPVKTRSSRSSTSKTRKTRSSAQSNASKNFICKSCHKSFDRAFNLRTHEITHVALEDREKPFVCPWSACTKPFMRKYDAERHYTTVHVKKGEIATSKQIIKAFSGEHGVPAQRAVASLLSDADITQANG